MSIGTNGQPKGIRGRRRYGPGNASSTSRPCLPGRAGHCTRGGGQGGWAKHDIAAVVAAGLMAPSVAEFRAEDRADEGRAHRHPGRAREEPGRTRRPVLAGQAVGARCLLRQGARPRQRGEAVPLGAGRRRPAASEPHRHGGGRPPPRPAPQPSPGSRRDRDPSRRSDHARRDGVLAGARCSSCEAGRASPPFARRQRGSASPS